MKDEIDCNKINEIREEKMQTQFYTGSAKSMPTSSSQATHLRFFILFVKYFYKVWTMQGQPIPCVQESLQLKRPSVP